MSTIRETVEGLRGGGRGWTLLAVAVGWLFINGFRVVLPALLPQVKADFVVTSASAGFALFLAACALFGIGAGLFGTPRDMFLSRTYPETDNTAYGVTFAAGSIGAASLPYVATAAAIRWGWRPAVVWLVPLLLVVAAGLWWVSPPTRPTAGAESLPLRETVRRTLGALTDRSVLTWSWPRRPRWRCCRSSTPASGWQCSSRRWACASPSAHW